MIQINATINVIKIEKYKHNLIKNKMSCVWNLVNNVVDFGIYL